MKINDSFKTIAERDHQQEYLYMITMNFLLFLSILEVTFLVMVVAVIQGLFIKKYRPYYMANTQPHLFLRKYIQRLIKQTRKFASGFEELAESGDKEAYKTRQNMTARLNWLVLERDFATTTDPDIRYWEDLNKRIKEMLTKWKEVEIIKEPPELEIIRLAIDGDDGSDGSGSGEASAEAKAEIKSLKKRIFAMSGYESMYKEMEMAYNTLDSTYNELKDTLKGLELEAGEAEKLREVLKQQEAQEESLNAMMDEMEASKARLSDELQQLEEAYGALEDEVVHTNVLSHSDNPDAQEIVQILNEQESLLAGLKDVVENLKIKPEEKDDLNEFTDNIERSNKEINHSMQMLELERERLSEEVQQLQEEASEIIEEN